MKRGGAAKVITVCSYAPILFLLNSKNLVFTQMTNKHTNLIGIDNKHMSLIYLDDKQTLLDVPNLATHSN